MHEEIIVGRTKVIIDELFPFSVATKSIMNDDGLEPHAATNIDKYMIGQNGKKLSMLN